MRSFRALAVILLALAGAASPVLGEEKSDACRACHQDEKFRVQNRKLYDYFQEWRGSEHDLAGISCPACHGGDPKGATKEEAHRGMLPQSDPASPFHYKNIPKTCGGCHAEVLERFVKSRHYEMLETSGKGPSCITCHGSLDARVYSTTIVERACSGCHNKKTGNRPEVVRHAQEILGRLNHANGYRKGLGFFFRAIDKPQAMAKAEAAYSDVVHFWHEFDFKRLGPRSEELVRELKTLYVKTREERAEPKQP